MTWDDKSEEQLKNKLLTRDGKPLRILSTSLGIALLANLAFSPNASSASSTAPSDTNAAAGPKLVEWSSDEVKQYYDPAIDWNLPILNKDSTGKVEPTPQPTAEGASSGGGTGGTTIIQNSGFGWDDLILYHLLFNSGSFYSSRSWSTTHPSYYSGSNTRYQPKSYSSGAFQNKPVAGSSVRPKTSDSTGSITRRSTSSKPGGIGGTSSGFSSSSSSGSKSSGGFGG
jgi:hypothetical protein